MFRSAATCVLLTIFLAFPVAGLFALMFRFPLPFSGYRSGPGAVGPAMMAVLFYGITGGFVVLAALGAVAGAVAHKIAKQSHWSATQIRFGLALLADVAAALVMAILDKLIGAW